MSSPRPSDARSPAPESDVGGIAAEVRERGRPLLDALEERLPGSREHADATASWALATAVELGLGRDRSLAVRETARLHDIGRVYLEPELVARPDGALGPDEARRLDSHAAIGSRLAEGAGLPPASCGWLRYTRERYDGGGQPDGLFGGAIPLESRIIRTACAFAASMASAAHSSEWATSPSILALAEIRRVAGTELDRGAVEALASAVGRVASQR